jgi:hypothetical protein
MNLIKKYTVTKTHEISTAANHEAVPSNDVLDLNVSYCCALHELFNNSSSDRLSVSESCEIISPRDVVEPLPCAFVLHGSTYANAVGENDSVQVVMRWKLEKPLDLTRWVKVASAGGEWLEGTLEPTPIEPEWFEAPKLDERTAIRLKRSHVFRVRFADPKKYAGLEPVRKFWDRGCFVDECVLKGSSIRYLYREEPNLPLDEGVLFDSGWRVRSETRRISEKDVRSGTVAYVPLGAVLDKDDSWVDMMDEPVGTAFEKNPETGSIRQVRKGTRLGSFLWLVSKPSKALEADAR